MNQYSIHMLHVTTNVQLSPYSLETTFLIEPFMEVGNKNRDYGLKMDYDLNMD